MTRAVTDILYRTDGTAWASAPVTFTRKAGSFDDGSSWPPDEKQVTTDATGAYSVQLWPDASGSIRSRYQVTYPNGDTFYVTIPAGTTPISMPEVRAATIGPPVPPSALDAHVAAPDPHAGYLLPAEADLRYAALVHSQAWSTISGTPTTLGGYGITDGEQLQAGAAILARVLLEWTTGEAYDMIAVTYDPTYTSTIASATVVWPDSSAGTFTADTINAAYEAIDAYHITHSLSGTTISQAAVTRNANGDIASKPALVVG